MKLSKEELQAIDNYGDRIESIDNFMLAVRQMPGMYIGHTGNKGFVTMCREIFQNSIDQILDSSSPGNWFSFFMDERSLQVVVEDNGLSLPYDDIIRILTTEHTSKNYHRGKGEYSTGQHGLGSKCVNALSSSFSVEAYHYDGTAMRVDFEFGNVIKGPYKIPNKEKKQGAKFMFVPDLEIMGSISIEWRELYRLIKTMISLCPIGTQMDFSAIDIHGKQFTEHIVNTDGIITNIIQKTKYPIIKPIVLGNDDGTRKIDIALCYDAGDPELGPNNEPNITSFCNFCPTVSGTHVDGTIDGIVRWFTNYMNNIYLVDQKNKNKLKVIFNDIKMGLNVMISAAHVESILVGQSKEMLSNPDMIPFAKDVVIKGLDEWSKSNPQDLAKLSKFFKEVAELRIQTDKSKAKIVSKFKSNTITGLPQKYIRPLGKKNIELIIVEGDSAKGTVETGRDRYTQGIFPIRGKIINAFDNSKEKFFSNEEVQGIIKIIFGTDYKKGLTVEDCKVDKVIFAADADVDGAHIAALLLRFFVLYLPFMIQAGMVYKAIPPLYSIKDGKVKIKDPRTGKTITRDKRRYFTEQIDIVKYIQKLFQKEFDMQYEDKSKVSNKDLTLFFMNNTDYIYYLEDNLANMYALNPFLLELILNHYVLNNNSIKLSKLQKEIKSKYRFMDVYKENNNIVIKGTIEGSNFIIFNDKFLEDCNKILEIINSNNGNLYYYINGTKMSILEIMKLYKDISPNGIQRYKGLGEMQDWELAESTLYPGSDRTLVRYTMEDALDEINAIREYESDTKKILTLVNNVSREDLLD